MGAVAGSSWTCSPGPAFAACVVSVVPKLINTPSLLGIIIGMAHDQLEGRCNIVDCGAGSCNYAFDDDECLDWMPWLQTGGETAKAFYYAISELRLGVN